MTSMSRDQLIESHMPLVAKIAKRVKRGLPAHVDLNDLISEGYVGLVQAADRFDTNKGLAFATLAGTRIHGAIVDYLRSLKMNARNSKDATFPSQLPEGWDAAYEEQLEVRGDIARALSVLPHKHRQLIIARIYLDVDYKTICARLGLSESSAFNYYRRSLSLMRDHLQGVQHA